MGAAPCGRPKAIRFLGEDESYIICKGRDFVGIECGLHGDLGPSGSRGSTRSLKKLGRPLTRPMTIKPLGWTTPRRPVRAPSASLHERAGCAFNFAHRHFRKRRPPDSHLLGREVSRVVYRRLKKRPRWIWLTNPLTALALWFLIVCQAVRSR